MPRKPRFFVPGVAVHVVQRGRSREPVFFDHSDYVAYKQWMREAAQRYGCAVHAYVLMTNHVHILVTPSDAAGVSRMMQYLGRHYVPYLNHTYGMSGSVWEGRYKCSLVQEGRHLLTCMRYIELNPVRAGMTKMPGEYRWSSYCHNAYGREDACVTPHATYCDLSSSIDQRCMSYRALFEASLDQKDMGAIRAAWQTGTPWGNARFKESIERTLERKVGHARRGKPPV
jgi:putative transposase